MKDRPINIQKLEKLCSSHLTTTKIIKIDDEYRIIIYNQDKFNKSITLKEETTSYKKMINEIMKVKKELKNIKKILL